MDQSIITKYRKAKQINPLSQKELAYIAGYIDAKGSITCSNTHKTAYWRIRISADNSNHAKKIHDLMGIGKLSTGKRNTITIGLKESITLINSIIKYSSIKKRQLLLMLDYINNSINQSMHQNISHYIKELNNYNQTKIGNYPEITNMDEYTGYVSGLWDGNGVCNIHRNKLIIGIYNTVLAPLQYLNESISSKIVTIQKKLKKHSTVYMLKISDKTAVDWFYNNLFSDSNKAKTFYKLYKKLFSK